MKLKNFDNYAKFYSKDPLRFEKRVALASKFESHPLFEKISNLDELASLDREIPLIMWDKFSFNSTNESASPYLYNRTYLQDPKEIIKAMRGEEFMPKMADSRATVKGLKFPIIGIDGSNQEEYKTYHKFKSSEKTFPIYQEKIKPRGRYEVVVLDEKPIHMIKRVSGVDFDANTARFKWQDQLDTIITKVKELSESNVFIINVLEKDNKLFLEKVSQEGELNDAQSVKLYEKLYESHYSTQLPTWFKKHVKDKYLTPHYKKKYHDSLLLKPTGVINYEGLI
jgi:hypothetical protein